MSIHNIVIHDTVAIAKNCIENPEIANKISYELRDIKMENNVVVAFFI